MERGGGGRELEAEIHLTFTPKEGRRLAASVAVRFG